MPHRPQIALIASPLFMQQGIPKACMADSALRTGIPPKTPYRHVHRKVWLVALSDPSLMTGTTYTGSRLTGHPGNHLIHDMRPGVGHVRTNRYDT